MKKGFFKVLTLMLALVISLPAFYGCKKRVANDENTLEIYVADFGYGYEWLNDIIAEFKAQSWVKEKYPNLNIPAVRHNSERSWATDRIKTDTNTIDLFFTVQSGASEYEQTYGNGKAYYSDLSDLYSMTVPGESVTVAEKMDDNFLAMNTYTKKDGSKTHYSYPWVSGMQGMLYNKTLFSEKGVSVPNTTKELEALCAELISKNVTPFVFTTKENYWTCMMFLIWWAQYEGLENYSNFYQGIVDEDGVKTMSADVFKQTGRLRSLETIENLISYPEHEKNNHSDVNVQTFTQAQAKFLVRQGAMMPNGDWFETEMTKTAKNDGITDQFAFMKTPVISTIVEKLEDKNMSDETLSAVISAIDSGATSYDGVSAADFAKIKEARSLVLPVGNHIALIPDYSNAKELAKDFLLFFATDKANEIFIKSTNGASAPFKYDVRVKNPSLYEKLPELQKSRLALSADALYMLNENTYAGVYYGGISRFTETRTNVEALFTAHNAADRMTAKQIYQAEIDHWDSVRWNTVLVNMGLK